MNLNNRPFPALFNNPLTRLQAQAQPFDSTKTACTPRELTYLVHHHLVFATTSTVVPANLSKGGSSMRLSAGRRSSCRRFTSKAATGDKVAVGQVRLTSDKFSAFGRAHPCGRFAAGKYKKPIPRPSERVIRLSVDPGGTPCRKKEGTEVAAAGTQTRRGERIREIEELRWREERRGAPGIGDKEHTW